MNNFNFNGPIGSNQIGDNNTANVTQNIGVSAEELASIFTQMRQDICALPPTEQAKAEKVIGELEEENQKDEPNPSVRKFLGAKLWGVADKVLTAASTAYLLHELGVGK